MFLSFIVYYHMNICSFFEIATFCKIAPISVSRFLLEKEARLAQICFKTSCFLMKTIKPKSVSHIESLHVDPDRPPYQAFSYKLVKRNQCLTWKYVYCLRSLPLICITSNHFFRQKRAHRGNFFDLWSFSKSPTQNAFTWKNLKCPLRSPAPMFDYIWFSNMSNAKV